MDISKTYEFNFPTKIYFGCGVRNLLAERLKQRGVWRPLIVTDQGLAATPIPAAIKELLRGFETVIFSEIFGNPTASQVVAGVTAYRRHGADAIVALGGGAAVDVAKAIGLLINHPGTAFDYEDGRPDAKPIDRMIPLLVALPTTAGTGSEVGRSTVISDDQTKVKKIIFSPKLLPQMVFADPDLTLDLPAPITAATGMDAVTHLVEAYLARGFNPICDGIALEGLRLAARNLVRAVKEGQNREARAYMLLASMMGAIAFQKGLGATHSFAHALSTVCNLHHGLANGIMIPFVMKFNQSAVSERFDDLARACGLAKGSDFVPWLIHTRAEIGIPDRLAAAGVKKEHLPKLVEVAVVDACHPLNPKPVTQTDFQRIFEEALS